MRRFNRITYFENRRRIAALEAFKSNLIGYIQDVHHDDDGEIVDTDSTFTLRSSINRSLDQIHGYIAQAGVNTTVLYKPPFGTTPYPIDVVLNVFSLSQHRINYRLVFDHIDRAIGIYQSDKNRSIRRTISPMFWALRILENVVELPFSFLGIIGFDKTSAEASTVGRVVKGILYLITILAALLTSLQLLGYLEAFKKMIGI